MKYKDSQINDFYQSGLYQEKNPTLHEEDSPWKFTLILPLIKKVIAERPRKKSHPTRCRRRGGFDPVIADAVNYGETRDHSQKNRPGPKSRHARSAEEKQS